MRTTLTIDDDVLQGARQIADVSARSLGTVISDLARQTLVARELGSVCNGIWLLPINPHAAKATLADVNELRDDPASIHEE